MKCEVVGGSFDGEIVDLPLWGVNYQIRIPFDGIPQEPPLRHARLLYERYEYRDGRYHFVGYEE